MKTILKMIAATAFCGLSAGAFASTEEQKPIEFTYDRDTREAPAQQINGLCPIRIVPTVDARQNKETIGQVFPRGPLLSGDLSPWITAGLNDLKSYGATLDAGGEAVPPQDGLLIKTSLTRAYTWQVGLKIFSMVALKAQFLNKNGVVQEKYYRAHGDKTNMWSAESEFVTTLNYGLNNLLPVLAQDLATLCKGEPVEKYSYAGPVLKPAK